MQKLISFKNITITLVLLIATILFAEYNDIGLKRKPGINKICIGFYNLENLHHPTDEPLKRDEEFTPTGSKLYSYEIYYDKLSKLSKVISELGIESGMGLAILGVGEVENLKVLEDLIKQDNIINLNYKAIHFDSPDERGIDVGMIYQKKLFKPLHIEPVTVTLRNPSNQKERQTRDILYVQGLLMGEPIHIFINHWPSRRGGQETTEPYRVAAARACRHKIDSIQLAVPDHKIFVMGDFNDDPVDKSITKELSAKGKITRLNAGNLYNPFYITYKKGIGTLAYRGKWNLFDQILLSQNLLDPNGSGYIFEKAVIYKRSYLIQQSGKYKGYPFRSYNYDIYAGGYSDHFPVYIILKKEIDVD